MLARHWLSSGICMCLFVTSRSSVETDGRIELVLAFRLFSTNHIQCLIRKFTCLQKYGHFLLKPCPKLWTQKIAQRVVDRRDGVVSLGKHLVWLTGLSTVELKSKYLRRSLANEFGDSVRHTERISVYSTMRVRHVARVHLRQLILIYYSVRRGVRTILTLRRRTFYESRPMH